jgi:iron(III) transport system ATP-binding protein
VSERRERHIQVERLVKTFGDVQVVRDVSFTAGRGEVIALLGPSGCGKTTTLKCIAGLERPDGGSVRLGDRVVYDHRARINLPPNKRELGMVFQSYAVWPHMTVSGNVAFPLEARRMGRREVRERVMAALRLVNLEHLATRPATALSGGQQQRVALARALVAEPTVVLFDEPLSNLDANLRERMRFEIAELQARVGFTGIYVTHDQEEAMAVAGRLVLMREGEVHQAGSPEEVYSRPRDTFVAHFMGIGNALDGEVVATDGEVVVRLSEGGEVRGRSASALRPGTGVRVFFAPSSVHLTPADGDNRISGQVEGALFLGYGFDYQVRVRDAVIHCRDVSGRRPLAVGSSVTLGVPSGACAVIARDMEEV